MKYLILLFLLLLVPLKVHAAIGIDTSSSVCQASGQSKMAWNITTTASANRVVTAWVNEGSTTTAVTYFSGGATSSMSLIGTNTTGTNGFMSVWSLANENSGVATITATFSSAQPGSGIAVAYTGAAQTGIPDASTTQDALTGATFTQSSTPVAANSWLVGIFNSNQAAAPTAASGTLRANVAGGVTCYSIGVIDTNAPESAKNSLVANGTSGFWSGIMLSLAPAVTVSTPYQYYSRPILVD